MLYHEATADEALSIADLTPAYSGVSRLWRGMRLSKWDGSVLLQDEIEAASPVELWSFFHVKLDPSQIEISADGTEAMLTTPTGRMWAKLLGSPGSQWEVRDPVPLATSPNPAGQNDNAGYQKLAIHLPSVTSRRVAVWFVPLVPGENPPTTMPVIEPLEQWQPAADNRVWLGDVDDYAAGGVADAVPVDAAWRSEIVAATGLPAADFDTVADGQVVPMSFFFNVPSGQQVSGARLDTRPARHRRQHDWHDVVPRRRGQLVHAGRAGLVRFDDRRCGSHGGPARPTEPTARRTVECGDRGECGRRLGGARPAVGRNWPVLGHDGLSRSRRLSSAAAFTRTTTTRPDR